MKMSVIAFSALGIVSLLADGPPRGSFSPSEFEKARAQSIESGKPIAVILTSFDGSCPKTDFGNAQVEKEMKRDYVLIYDSPRTLTGTGGPLLSAMNASMKSKGNLTPCVAVVDGKTLGYLSGVSYKGISQDTRKWEKTLRTEIEAAKSEIPEKTVTTPEESTTPAAADTSSTGMRDWTNFQGKTIRAELISSTPLKATFKLESGKFVDYDLNLLSAESRAIIEDTE